MEGLIDKSESFTSLCNIGSLEERNIQSKVTFMDRDLILKNSFHEWSPTLSSALLKELSATNLNMIAGLIPNFQISPTKNFEDTFGIPNKEA